ncbi:carboxypeptidase S1 [Diaporthe helianthi]|uniref:Carboxypeptidase S1 n=1 Tax=Diaporthe helianthi TaxID=158607 RepID=A0A2P5IDN2_DIAHE|nr:carboxypeptidase S1 [Diaporthe helianthi]
MAPISNLVSLVTLLSVSGRSIAQFVPPPTDLISKTGYADVPVRYKEVPVGTCELDPNVKSYSGYADVGEDEHIFWWFFEARNQDPSEADLTVWINGGPGSSSMIGLFQENGPCRVDADGNVVNNPYSWSNASNMLFIDQPVGTGFSYSKAVPSYQSRYGNLVQLPDNTCPEYARGGHTCGTWSSANETLTANSTANAAPNFWKTLQGFMGAFPQYSRGDFNFATESYGGHYGPVFNTYIEQQNELIRANSLSAHEINLKSVLIGNGWFDPLIQYAAYYNFTVSPGNTYDYFPFSDSIAEMMYNAMWGKGNCYDQTVECNTNGVNEICSAADDFCATEVEFILDSNARRDEYDIRQLQPDPFPPTFYVDYLNTGAFQSAIGAFVNFTEGSSIVGNAFSSTGDDDRVDGTVEDMSILISKNLTVVMFFGDADYNCNWLGGEVVAEEINAPGWSGAGYVNISTSDDIVHGQVKQSGAFSFVRIYDSGHEVPFYKPVVALEMFERAINAKDIATGLADVVPGEVYLTNGTAKSTYREGNSTVQFKVLPASATYNTSLNGPNPVSGKELRRSMRYPLFR